MPVVPVLLRLAGLGDLRQLGFELLKADNVGPVAAQPFRELRLPGADSVDVPGGDPHRHILPGSAKLSRRHRYYNPATMKLPCPQCGAVYPPPPTSCADQFAVLLALDHSRREPWGSRHGLAFAAYSLQ